MIQEKVELKNSKGRKIIGLLNRPAAEKEQEPIVILCPGFSGSKDNETIKTMSAMLNKEGIATFALDFHGRGESEGSIEETTLTEAVDDLKTALDFVENLQTTKNIGAWGYSFGGMAIIAAADPRIEVSVLVSPVSNPLEVWTTEGEYAKWKEQGSVMYWGEVKLNYSFYEDIQKYNLYDQAKKLQGFNLIIHGEADETVSFEQSRHLFENIESGKELVAIKDCRHHYERQTDVDEMFSRSIEWFKTKFKELV